jgi:hypothetical protein
MAKGATLIEHLVAVAVCQVATNAQLSVLGHTAHPVARLRGWQEDVRKLPPMPGLGDVFDVGERYSFLDSLLSISRDGPQGVQAITGGGLPPGPRPSNPITGRMFTRSIDWDPAFRNANQLFDRCAAASRLTDPVARRAEYRLIAAEVAAAEATIKAAPLERLTEGQAARGERVGNILLGLLFPAMEKVQTAADRIEQVQADLQVALALAAYRAETGRYPANLKELAPKYIDKVPGDLFSGTALVYLPTETGYRLYSVGANGTDDGGRSYDDEPRGDDLVVRMPVPEPKGE